MKKALSEGTPELLYHVARDDSVIGSVERSVAHRDQLPTALE